MINEQKEGKKKNERMKKEIFKEMLELKDWTMV